MFKELALKGIRKKVCIERQSYEYVLLRCIFLFGNVLIYNIYLFWHKDDDMSLCYLLAV